MLLITGLVLVAGESSAISLCTSVPDHEAYPVPMDERESDRTIRNRLFNGLIERGDTQAAKGRPGRAAAYYLGVFAPFQHNGFSYGPRRCADPSIYQQAADKLRTVAIPYAEKLIADGEYESAGKYDELRGGALYLLLYSNSYDAFIKNSFEYAVRELPDRDVDGYLQGLIDGRLRKLRSAADTTAFTHSGYYVDDTAPLLDEERAAFDELADFQSQLQAHLKPLYPKITDSRLDEEANSYRELNAHDAEFVQMQNAQYGIDALGQGLSRLRNHPAEVRRLKARGNERGEALMAREKYALARLYFDVAGNDEAKARADSLAEQDAEERLVRLKSDAQELIDNMQKTDAEKAEFEAEADAMAKEFGFDLEN